MFIISWLIQIKPIRAVPFLWFSVLFYSCHNASEHRKETEKLISENSYEEALIEIHNAIQLEPDSGLNYLMRIVIYNKTGRFIDAIADWDKIVELGIKHNKNSAFAHYQRAIAEVEIGSNQNALNDINYFISNKRKAGTLAEAYLIKGSIFFKLNQKDSSELYYTLSGQLSKDNNKSTESQAFVGLATLAKSPNDALKLLNKAISIDDSCTAAYSERAAIYLNFTKIELAYEDLKKAISKSNHNEIECSIIYFNMGQLFLNQLKNNDSATKYFEKAIALSPQSPNNDIIYMNLAIIQQRSGKLDSSLANFQKAEAINSKNDIVLYNLALLLSDLNKSSDALEKINKAININSSNADYFNFKGSILLDLSEFNAAEKEFKKALKINPSLGIAYYNLGFLYGEQNDHSQSIKYYDKAILLNYDLKATLVNRALQKIEINKTSSACIDLERAYKLGRIDIKPLIEKDCR